MLKTPSLEQLYTGLPIFCYLIPNGIAFLFTRFILFLCHFIHSFSLRAGVCVYLYSISNLWFSLKLQINALRNYMLNMPLRYILSCCSFFMLFLLLLFFAFCFFYSCCYYYCYRGANIPILCTQKRIWLTIGRFFSACRHTRTYMYGNIHTTSIFLHLLLYTSIPNTCTYVHFNVINDFWTD